MRKELKTALAALVLLLLASTASATIGVPTHAVLADSDQDVLTNAPMGTQELEFQGDLAVPDAKNISEARKPNRPVPHINCFAEFGPNWVWVVGTCCCRNIDTGMEICL